MTSVFLNGKTPPFMESVEPVRLTPDQISKAAMGLTYSALRIAAAGYFSLFQSLGNSPAEAVEVIRAAQALEETTPATPEGAIS